MGIVSQQLGITTLFLRDPRLISQGEIHQKWGIENVYNVLYCLIMFYSVL